MLEKERTLVRLVINDVLMLGELNGDDLAIIIGERYECLPVILMFGYAEQGIRQDVLERDVPLLTKRVAIENLLEVLHDKLKLSNERRGDS